MKRAIIDDILLLLFCAVDEWIAGTGTSKNIPYLNLSNLKILTTWRLAEAHVKILCEASHNQAYRKACMKYHPDRNPSGEHMMKLVNAAYAY